MWAWAAEHAGVMLIELLGTNVILSFVAIQWNAEAFCFKVLICWTECEQVLSL